MTALRFSHPGAVCSVCDAYPPRRQEGSKLVQGDDREESASIQPLEAPGHKSGDAQYRRVRVRAVAASAFAVLHPGSNGAVH